MRVFQLWTLRIGGGLLVTHLGGLLLLLLVQWIEGQPMETILERLPRLWAAISAALTLLGATLACYRMRREGIVLALGSLGVNPRGMLLIAALLGAGIGIESGREAGHRPPVAGTWQRVQGGWWKDGLLLADPGKTPAQLRPPEQWSFERAQIGIGGAAGAFGAGLGLYGGAITTLLATGGMVVGGTLVRGLVQRGILGEAGSFSPAAVLLLLLLLLLWAAPIFPRRNDVASR